MFGVSSLSREQCETAHDKPPAERGNGIPVLQSMRYVAAALDAGMDEALASLGLSAQRVELHTALAALIRNPAAIERWRAGRALIKT